MTAKRLRGPQLVKAVADCTGFEFTNAALVEEAMTHASARSRSGSDYQRLEFLGDRVLGLAVAELLYESFPKAPEGELSVRLNALVNAETLAEVADELKISPLIHMGSDLRGAATRKQINLRADVMEALIAVVYLEGGIELRVPLCAVTGVSVRRPKGPIAAIRKPPCRNGRIRLPASRQAILLKTGRDLTMIRFFP